MGVHSSEPCTMPAQVVHGEWCSTLSKTLRDKCKCTKISLLRFERNEKIRSANSLRRHYNKS
ncbi:unnamed protein product [Ixodes pacificus]